MSTAIPNKPSTETSLLQRFRAVRDFTTKLCEPLTPEDCCIQAAPFASPTRWHLAHTTWFFETFLLKSFSIYQVFDPHYEILFNSYYNTVGEQFPRPRRGLLSRPSLAEVYEYRRHIDDAVTHAFKSGRIGEQPDLANIIEWGLQHEQQHQELILTDVKYLFWQNPLLPAYRSLKATGSASDRLSNHAGFPAGDWQSFPENLYEIGQAGPGFAYDNESPRHRVFLESFQLATRAVSSGEYLAFIEDGGYRRPELWLSDGWGLVTADKLAHPLYWFQRDGQWQEFTLAGPRALDLDAPMCHLCHYEADAYARWAGARLPTEAEWEVAAAGERSEGNFVDTLLAEDRPIHPIGRHSLFGNVWQWTASAYLPYPGYQPPNGALGEYNGKFMSGQMVLRGGSCATPSTHIRATYRNFFSPDARWQFTGLRLAR